MRRWGNQPVSLEQVKEKYKPRIFGIIPCYGYVIDLAEISPPGAVNAHQKSIGYIQSHWLRFELTRKLALPIGKQCRLKTPAQNLF